MIAMGLYGFLLMFGLMVLLWIIHLAIKNAAIVDAGWAGGLALLGVLYAAIGNGYPLRKWLIAGMAFIWGMRLALHLLFDRIIGKEEEGRYQQLRKEWKTSIPLKFFFFFEFQALLNLILATPFLLACRNNDPQISILEWAGVAIWLIALGGEAIADQQLKRFKSDPQNKGKVCRTGLWNYSRHPNYFFEWLVWIAYFTFAMASPYGWISIVCPAIILYLLFKITGIPATEAQALRTKGEAYREYQQSTSAFVPWLPRR